MKALYVFVNGQQGVHNTSKIFSITVAEGKAIRKSSEFTTLQIECMEVLR